MKNSKTTDPRESGPAVQRALDFIKSNLEKGTWKQGEILPSTRSLAARAGVSFVTMIRAIASLKTQSVVSGFPRSRLRAGDGSVVNASDVTRDGPMNPAVLKSCDFIKSNLDNGVWRHGENLPSTRHLAARAGVSSVAMAKAIAALRAQGLLSGVPRGHIRAGDESSAGASSVQSDDAAWQLKRTALEADLLSGHYAHQGRLPSFKELQTRYGVCFRTMRKILRSMVADGVLQLTGKAYQPHNVENRPGVQRIVFITYHLQASHQSALNMGEYRILDLIEYECNRRGIELDIVEIDFYDSVEARRMISGSAVTKKTLGYILDLWWYPGEVFRRSHFDLLTKLDSLKRPVSILDEVAEFVLPLPFAANPLFQVFRIEGRRAGARMARMLLGMGHRSAAYISPTHIWPWSKQRLEGVTEAYAKAGCAAGLWPVVRRNIEINQDQILAMSGFDDELIKRILAVNGTESQGEEAFKTFLRFRESFTPDQFAPDVVREIEKNLSIVADLARRDPSVSLFNGICREVFTREIGTFVSMKARLPLFEQALACKDVTAWICASDGIALSALAYLKGRGISVPGQLSIVGFDNTPVKAPEQRLTSFDFNANGFVHRMLNFVVRPPHPRGKYHHSAIEVEGVIIQRDTTGPRKSEKV